MVYELKDLFKEYMFEGTIGLEDDHSNFSLEIVRYDEKKQIFVGMGIDEVGLAAIIGNISSIDETRSKVEFKRIRNKDNANTLFNGDLEKTESGIILLGNYGNTTTRRHFPFALGIAPRDGKICPPSYLERAMDVVLPTK